MSTETVPRPADEDFDPDDYIRTAVTYGRLDLVKDWLPHHRDDPRRVSELVLFPAAMFGQLELLGFGLDYGNVNYREEHQPCYKGWNLMHFAVNGIHMNVPSEENKQESQNGGTQQSVLLNMPEIHGRLLDIVALLLSRGVDPTVPDSEGNIPSDKASVITSREECFLDGALLLDIHVCTHAVETGGVVQPPRTPGLETLKKLPEDMQWGLALQPLLQWAYSRLRYDVLVFCHNQKFVDLTQPSLSLGTSNRPLMIDAIHRERYAFLRHLIESSIGQSVFIQKLLTKVYEYNLENYGQSRETLLSYACRAYTSGNQNILPSLLSPETLGRHLTHIKIENVGLESVPLPIFSAKLTHLELSKNQLTTLPIEDALSQGLCKSLQELIIANNAFSEISKYIFRLPRLTKLDARNNRISKVPEEIWTAPCLEDLYLSKNAISTLPCPDYVYLSHGVQVSSVQSRVLSFPHYFTGSDTRHVQSCRQSYLTAKTPDSDSISGGFRLKTLDLFDNQLTEIPPGLPCLAPQLRNLKLSNNRIVHLGHPCNYPQLLEKLDVKGNMCKSCIQWCAEPPNLVCAQSQLRKEHSSCFHIGHKTLNNLKFLFLEDNHMTCVMLEECQREQQGGSAEWSAGSSGSGRGKHESCESGDEVRGEGERVTSAALPTLMFQNLESLRLSNNLLESVPSGIHRHVEMRELKLDRNAGITHLPSNLHHLRELFFFSFEGISDPVVTELRSCSNTPEQLLYLKAREKHYCRNTAMRLFVIGHFSKGKSTVVAALRKMRQSSTFDERARRLVDSDYHLTEDDRQSTVGIQCDKWLYKRSAAVRDATEVTFYTWDFAGQEEYYLTHQCFFTNRALYLLVWNVTDGRDGITSLTVWLQNLQAKAPGSSVIVVGTHLDQVPRTEREEKVKVWMEMVSSYKQHRVHSHLYPSIMGVAFVGIPKKGRQIGVHGPDGLADCIYDVAMKMEVPNGPHLGGSSVKMMQEMIPMAYEALRRRIDSLQEQARRNMEPPILAKDTFWAKVKGIEGLDKDGVEAAVDFLHASTGMILHFPLPHLVDYYIIDPQCWFDLCALVISPSNVSKLIHRAGIIARGNGQLVARLMDQALEKQGLGLANFKKIGSLIRQFLMEHGVVHKIDAENYLVPSAIHPDPNLPLDLKLGYFPFQTAVEPPGDNDDEYEQLSPYTSSSPKLSLVSTGLVYRRTLHLPPIASGFWSKLISLCIQHDEILLLISGDGPNHERRVGTNRLRGMVDNVSIEWQYWKTGIMLIADDKLLMRVNSLRRDVFEDPKHQFVISSTLSKVEHFQYQEAGQWTDIPGHLSEVIEIIVPVTYLADSGGRSFYQEESTSRNSVSAKLMAKVLELVDEILKNHCEHLAMNGIYTVNDMLHLVPCPLCYGDEDSRPPQASTVEQQTRHVNRRERHTMANARQREVYIQRERAFSKSIATVKDTRKLYTFRVDECIEQTLVSDSMSCPQHGKLEIAYLAPDLAFVDLALLKLDRKKFNKPIDKEEPSNLRGSFAKVVKRTFNTLTSEGSIEVAVKIFVQSDSVQPSSAIELAKNYADMRYELNKLSTMNHPLIVRFVGVLTNPLCFVLEWAPGKSLEHIRKAHVEGNSCICPTSLFLVLLQVADALTYLHQAVKIIHNDLRCSNILVFQFPPTDHHCLKPGVTSSCAACLSSSESCGVLMKVADMGICANPATQKTKNKQGIRRFVPECLNFDATLTNKVDIFYLGTCLYELMSLRPLPPENREAEYRTMLKMGKREGFNTKDTAYPSFLYQVLEECWQQEQHRRPSAALLHTALVGLTGLSVRGDSSPTQTTRSLLLDSYVPYRSSRLSVIHSVVEGGVGEGGLRYVACAALSSLTDNCTSIVALKLSQTQHNQDCMMETKSLWNAGNSSVCVVHMTADGVVLAALADGRVMVFNTTNKTCSFIEPEKNCSECNRRHSEIVAIHSVSSFQLLAIGFACSKIQVCSYQEIIHGSLDVHCHIHLSDGLSLHSLLCINTAPSTSTMSSGDSALGVWCGTSSSSVVIWELSLTPGPHWMVQEVMHNFKSVSVCTEEQASTSAFTAKDLKLSADMSTVVALLHQPRSQVSSLALIDTATKSLHHYMTCDKISVSSLTLTPTKLVLGTYEGLIHLFDWHNLRQTSPPALQPLGSETLTAHHKCVYSITCVCGGVTPEGLTTVCPTFVGRCAQRIEKEFLISVGYGKHSVIAVNKATSSLFRSFTLHAGVCLCVWMI